MKLISQQTYVNDFFLNKLYHKFDTDEKRYFANSFMQYLEYFNDASNFVIDLDDIWNWLGFISKGKAKAKLLLLAKQNEDYTVINEPNTSRGGHNREKILLTIPAFKRFSMMSNTERSKQVCQYYMDLENVLFEYIQEQYMQKEQEHQLFITNLQTQHMSDMEMTRHQSLVDGYANKKVVYFIKMKNMDGTGFILKIGSTDNIKDRCYKIKNEFQLMPLVLDVFECDKFTEFEKCLHADSYTNKFKYISPLNNKHSIELYALPSLHVYDQFKRIAQKHVLKYKYYTLNEIKALTKLEAAKAKTYQEQTKLIYAENKSRELDIRLKEFTIMNNKNTSQFFCCPKNDAETQTDTACKGIIETCCQTDDPHILDHEITTRVAQHNLEYNINADMSIRMKRAQPLQVNGEEENDIVAYNNQNGALIQMYDIMDLQRVKHVFYGMTEALRELPKIYGESFQYVNRSSIKNASIFKTEYLGHRWNLLDRSKIEDINKAFDIGETKQALQQNKGHLAILDANEQNILNTFATRKDLAEYLHVKSQSLISTCIHHHNGRLYGHDNIRIRTWDEIPQDIRDAYSSHHTLAGKTKRDHGKKIDILRSDNCQLVETHTCIDSVCKKYKVSPNTVKRLCVRWDCNEGIYKGDIRFRLHQ